MCWVIANLYVPYITLPRISILMMCYSWHELLCALQMADLPALNYRLTEKQAEAQALMGSTAQHILLRGGARSGKTFIICRAVIIRAIKAPGSTHAVLRLRFNHLKDSIIYDTMPK